MKHRCAISVSSAFLHPSLPPPSTPILLLGLRCPVGRWDRVSLARLQYQHVFYCSLLFSTVSVWVSHSNIVSRPVNTTESDPVIRSHQATPHTTHRKLARNFSSSLYYNAARDCHRGSSRFSGESISVFSSGRLEDSLFSWFVIFFMFTFWPPPPLIWW